LLNFSTLNIFETLKNVKQFVRILSFISDKNFFLHFFIDNEQYSHLIAFFLKNTTKSLFVGNILSEKKLPKNTFHFLILLSHIINNDNNLFKSILNKNIFIVNKINSRLEKNNWGIYKIYNK